MSTPIIISMANSWILGILSLGMEIEFIAFNSFFWLKKIFEFHKFIEGIQTMK
jgi:hypothetical protein